MWFSVHAALLMGSTIARCGDEPGPTTVVRDRGEQPAAQQAAQVDPAQGARHAKLLGAGNCSWTTSMMASRALSEGVPYTFVGHLESSDNRLPSRVATPYTVGPDAEIHVVANQVLALMERMQVVDARLDLHGRLLEVQGVRYLVVTEFTPVGA